VRAKKIREGRNQAFTCKRRRDVTRRHHIFSSRKKGEGGGAKTVNACAGVRVGGLKVCGRDTSSIGRSRVKKDSERSQQEGVVNIRVISNNILLRGEDWRSNVELQNIPCMRGPRKK